MAESKQYMNVLKAMFWMGCPKFGLELEIMLLLIKIILTETRRPEPKINIRLC